MNIPLTFEMLHMYMCICVCVCVCVCVLLRALKIYSHSRLPEYNTTVLTTVLMQCFRTLDLFILHYYNFVPFDLLIPM
jgi:hypothetical protein